MSGSDRSVGSVAGDAGAELVARLDDLIEAHETLLAMAREHRGLIARADGAGVEALSVRQGELVRRIATLEQHRRAAARALVGRGGRRGDAEPTLQQVCAALPEPRRTEVAARAEKLRGLLGRVREEHRVVRRATTLMLGHMEGLMRQVAQALSHAGTYSRQGAIGAGSAAVVSALDLTT